MFYIKKLTFLLLFLPAVLFSQPKKDFANFGKYEKDNVKIQKNKDYPKTIFMGNSITELWHELHPNFFEENDILGRGISGQVTYQMLLRFREDVINLKPQRVVILAGTNDIAENQGPISLDKILGNIISMTELAEANNIEVFLSSVLPANKYEWNKRIKPADKIIKLNSMIEAYAKANDIPYIDYYPKLKNDKKGLPKKYAKDGVHPTEEAYEIMERTVLKALQ